MNAQNNQKRPAPLSPMAYYRRGLQDNRALLGSLAAPLYEVAKMRYAARAVQMAVRNGQSAETPDEAKKRLEDLKAGEKPNLQIFWNRLAKAVGNGTEDQKRERRSKLLKLLISWISEGLITDPTNTERCQKIYRIPTILVVLAQELERVAKEFSGEAVANDLHDRAREARSRFRDVKRFGDRAIVRMMDTMPAALFDCIGRFGYLWGWLRMVMVTIPAMLEMAEDDGLPADVQDELRNTANTLDRPGNGITAVPSFLKKLWEKEAEANPTIAAKPEAGVLDVFLQGQKALPEGETPAEPPDAETVPGTTDKPADAETVETPAGDPAGKAAD